MDLIKQLGTLALASRLKRLSDHLMSDVDRLYREQKVVFHPRWFPIAYLLDRKSPMAITAIADALGMTHPAINQAAGQMSHYGLLVSSRDKKDERRRLLGLSKKGRATVKALGPLWRLIKESTEEVLSKSGHDLIVTVTAIENELQKESIYHRVSTRLYQDFHSRLKIVEYIPDYKKYFRKLNYEWLEKYFEVENSDDKILSNPEKYVIRHGGKILFVLLDDAVVGTGALIRHDDRVYEIAKMAVTEKAQGKHIGQSLAQALLDEAKKLGAKEVIIATSAKLKAAVSLYSKLGFTRIKKPLYYPYDFKRKTIFMKVKIIQ